MVVFIKLCVLLVPLIVNSFSIDHLQWCGSDVINKKFMIMKKKSP